MVGQKSRMAETLKETISIILKIIFILIIIYVAFQVLKAILGGTWATENIIIAGMGIILAGMFVIVGFLINQGKVLGMLEQQTKNNGIILSNLGSDFKRHLSDK